MPCVNHPDVNERLVRCTRCGRSFCRDCVVQLRGFYYCGSCKGEHVRDIQSGAGPGVLDLASVGRRWLAVIVDQLLLGAVTFFVVMIAAFGAGAIGQAGPEAQNVAGAIFMVVYMLSVFGLPVVYDAVMVQKRGQTLGKMALGVKVVNVDGSDVSAGQAWGRSATKLLLGSC